MLDLPWMWRAQCTISTFHQPVSHQLRTPHAQMVLNMGSALRKATVQGHSASAHPLRSYVRRRSERRCPWCVLLCFWLCLLGGWAQPQSLPRPGKISSPPTAATPLSIAQPALQTYTDQQGLPQNSIRALVRDQQGRLWAATQDGAAYFDGHLWTPVPVPRALGSNFVTALAVTGDSVWLGTPNGLCRYDALAHPSQPWRVFSLGSERANNITALLAIPDDRAGGAVDWHARRTVSLPGRAVGAPASGPAAPGLCGAVPGHHRPTGALPVGGDAGPRSLAAGAGHRAVGAIDNCGGVASEQHHLPVPPAGARQRLGRHGTRRGPGGRPTGAAVVRDTSGTRNTAHQCHAGSRGPGWQAPGMDWHESGAVRPSRRPVAALRNSPGAVE